jgi:hypothetical protein
MVIVALAILGLAGFATFIAAAGEPDPSMTAAAEAASEKVELWVMAGGTAVAALMVAVLLVAVWPQIAPSRRTGPD